MDIASDTPLIGVVIITYGRRQSLLDTLEQLKAQTWLNWRAVVIDQNPEAVPFPPDSRIVRVWTPDAPSMYVSRNSGMEYLVAATATHICFWDDDDCFAPDYMAKMVAPFMEDDAVLLTCCRIKHQGRVLSKGAMSTPCRMVRVEAIGNKRWIKDHPKVEKVWWAQFDGLRLEHVDATLVKTGNNPIGGVRHRRARY